MYRDLGGLLFKKGWDFSYLLGKSHYKVIPDTNGGWFGGQKGQLIINGNQPLGTLWVADDGMRNGALWGADDGMRNDDAWAALSQSLGFMFSQHTQAPHA